MKYFIANQSAACENIFPCLCACSRCRAQSFFGVILYFSGLLSNLSLQSAVWKITCWPLYSERKIRRPVLPQTGHTSFTGWPAKLLPASAKANKRMDNRVFILDQWVGNLRIRIADEGIGHPQELWWNSATTDLYEDYVPTSTSLSLHVSLPHPSSLGSSCSTIELLSALVRGGGSFAVYIPIHAGTALQLSQIAACSGADLPDPQLKGSLVSWRPRPQNHLGGCLEFIARFESASSTRRFSMPHIRR